MQASFLYNLGLLFHLVGLFFLAGGILGSTLVERLLWQRVQQRQLGLATALLPLLRQLPMIIQVGVVLMPLSGVLMLQQVQWSYWGQFWLMGKLLLYVLMVLNGVLVAKPLGQQLAKTLMQLASPERSSLKDEPVSLPDQLPRLRQRLRLFSLSQTGMLVIIFILSTFKPV